MEADTDLQTLVLSSGYEPMAAVDWRRAMGMWVAGRVEIIENYADVVVRTVTDSYPMPSIVRFSHSAAWRRIVVRFSRDTVFVRDGGACQYCGLALSRARATWDHILPRSRGGRTSWDNVVIACKPCNQIKGNRTPEEAGMRLMGKPRRPRHMPTQEEDMLRYHPGMPEQWRTYLRH